mmetsp:Transcript_19236/g.39588  ORF Transcript_19236/g.39588 Transcript_19236/m.39588 type:complete len:569 (+) Transcript_19236:33-1739(+)
MKLRDLSNKASKQRNCLDRKSTEMERIITNAILISVLFWNHCEGVVADSISATIGTNSGTSTSSSTLSCKAYSYSTISEAIECISIPAPQDGIADPNQILRLEAKYNLSEKLYYHSSRLIVNGRGRVMEVPTQNDSIDNNYESLKEKRKESKDTDGATGFPVQIAVVIVEEMGIWNADGDLLDEDNEGEDVEKIAELFAMSLHNRWGVGYEITVPIDNPENEETNQKRGGGTGVLVFLSVSDRVVYISVGGALTKVLTKGRIDRVIANDMRPYFKRIEYDIGLRKGIDAIAEILKDGEEPSAFERFWEEWCNLFVSGLVYACVFAATAYQSRKLKREERTYAKAVRMLSELDQARAEALRGSYRPATSCPICLEDFKSESHGSDGRPVVLLRCGHVFDATCFEEWVAKGSGAVAKCPVCRMDVGPSGSLEDTDSIGDADADSVHTRTRLLDATENANSVEHDNGNDDNDQAMDLYQSDRNFRLERLAHLHPRYVTFEAVARWSSSSFHGSLARDPSFRSRDPGGRRRARQSSRSPSGSNRENGNYDDSRGVDAAFGGGSSGGGKGGRF